MIEVVSELVKQLVVVIFLATFLELLLPKGEFHRYIRMIVGVAVILIIVSSLYEVFGMLPNLEPLFRSAESTVSDERFLQHSAELQNYHDELILQEYRQIIHDRVAEEINKGGQWEVVEVEAAIEEDFDALNFGKIKALEVVVKPYQQSDKQSSSSPVSVEEVEVRIGKPRQPDTSPRPHQPLEGEAEDLLVNKLAALFQLSPEDISLSLARDY